jgi:hypothetical protein
MLAEKKKKCGHASPTKKENLGGRFQGGDWTGMSRLLNPYVRTVGAFTWLALKPEGQGGQGCRRSEQTPHRRSSG